LPLVLTSLEPNETLLLYLA
jgi:hypothetical protein